MAGHKSGKSKKKSADDPLSKIKHIVVVMLENRSFDNLLGWLYENEAPPRGQKFDGLRRDLWNPLDNIDANGIPFVEKVSIRKNGEPLPYGRNKEKMLKPDFTLPDPDPGEGYHSTNHQLFGTYDVALDYPPEPTNMGFVNDYRDANLYNTYSFGEPPTDPREVMITYAPEQAPVLNTLARQFAVCDHWYASVPSQTLPNRHFVNAATSEGAVNNKPNGICGARTIYNHIQDAIDCGRNDLSWAVYCGTSRDWKTKKEMMFSLTRSVMSQLHDKKYDPNFQTQAQFFKAAKDGKLPSYSFVEPQIHSPGGNDQHPPQDIRPGEQFIADVYNAVVNSPQWHETLLVITYDEHGGLYDHVAPPNGAVNPCKDKTPGQFGFQFNRFGVRVPTVLISPWIEEGTVARAEGKTPFDHTSVLATIRECFDLDGPLTERDAHAPDVGCVLTLKKPRKDKPEVKPLPYREKKDDDPLVYDLHLLIGDIMAEHTGDKPIDEDDLFQFIHRAYAKMFDERKV